MCKYENQDVLIEVLCKFVCRDESPGTTDLCGVRSFDLTRNIAQHCIAIEIMTLLHSKDFIKFADYIN